MSASSARAVDASGSESARGPHGGRPPPPTAPFVLILVSLAAAGGLHVLFRTATHGLALTADGLDMWSAALNFLDGEGLVDFSGRPLVHQPPLLALLMAAAGWVGLDMLEAARWANAAAFAATLLVLGLWLARTAWSRTVAAGAVLVAAAAWPLGFGAAHLLSEALMILLVVAALVLLDAFLHRGARPSALACAAGFAGLAGLARYPSVTVILAGLATLLLDRNAAVLARLKHAVVYGGVGSVPTAAVLTRNWIVAGTATGDDRFDSASVPDFLDISLQAGKALATWAAPGAGPEWFGHLPWIVAGTLCAAIVVALVAFPRAAGLPRAGVPAPDPAVRLFALFAGIYFAFMCTAVSVVTWQELDSRYLSPMFVPVVALAALLVDRFARIQAEGRGLLAKRTLTAAVLVGSVAHLAFAVRQNAVVTAEWRQRGNATWAAYNSAFWDESATLRAVSRGRVDAVVYSNDAPLLWYNDRSAPTGTYRRLPRVARRLGVSLDGESSIVWFDEMPINTMFYDVSDVLAMPRVRMSAEWDDGMLLRVSAPARTP